MIELCLPAGVVVVEAFDDMPGETVFPGEEIFIENAVETRRREFITARRCAREALASLGQAPGPIRAGASREPKWPPGLVGSITHTSGFRAAAVAPQSVVASIGIDAEQNEPLPDGIEKLVCVEGELEMLAALTGARPEVQWGRLLFSAKESVYKAWYPLTNRWLGFDDVRLKINPSGRFEAMLIVDDPGAGLKPTLSEFRGCFAVTRDLISTAVTVPPDVMV